MAFENTESHAIKAESAYAVARQYHVQGKYEQAEKFYKARPALLASRSVRRALLTPQVNPGSRYRCDRST